MKKIITLLMLVICGLSLCASPVSRETAQKVAVSYYKHYASKTSDYSIADVIVNNYNDITTFYVFTFQSGGFVMVSADDAVTPILGYSDSETFDRNNIPENAASWFESYSREIEYIVTNDVSNNETSKQWKNLEKSIFSDSKLVVTPLCSTTWDQGCYYNTMCPSDASGTWTCGHAYTGCVATCMSQIMKKWAYPTTGVGSHTYTDATYGSQTANFGSTTYNWSSMPNNVGSSNTAVATIMYHSGVAVNMQYGVDGSGAYSWDVPNALITYFNYSPSAEIQFKDDFTLANWIAMLKAELDAGRPVYYSGDNGASGHAFVCDGYNGSNQFHMNWGWSGSSNGYFTIGSLNPSGYSFNQNNAAVIRITPPLGQPVANFSASTTTPAVGGSVDFSDASSNTPTTWSWTFDGGSPSTSTSQNPANITYASAGIYQVTLTVSNASGTDTKTRSQYINVGGTPSAWIKQNTGFATASRGIDQISIVNPYIVWAKAYDGTAPTNYIREFTKTSNGGITWTPGNITFTNSTSYGVSNIFPMNDTIAYACMFPISGTGGKIVKTVDGGLTWNEQTTAPFTGSWANLVHFFNANDGVAQGDPTASNGDFMIYTTTDGGNNWTQVPVGNIPNASGTECGITNLYDVVGDIIWFGTTMGRVYKSTDKGYTWTVSSTGLTTSVVTPVFKDANKGIITGTNNSSGVYTGMKITTDGGATWNTLTPTGFFVKTPHIDFVPGTASMWIDVTAGTGKGSSFSLDDCASFQNIDTGSVQYTTVTFYDVNTGWAGGFNVSSTDGGIYKWNPDIAVNIPDIENPLDNILIYPNPASDMLNVEFTEFMGDHVTINVYNLIGELIYSQAVSPYFYDVIQIDLSSMKSGIYLVNVDDGVKMRSEKISLIK